MSPLPVPEVLAHLSADSWTRSLLQASEELEDRESLAVMAASGLQRQSLPSEDNKDFMEQYTQSISAVDTILALDRLRQSVAVKELLGAKGRLMGDAGHQQHAGNTSQFMRKTFSVPNFSHVSTLEFPSTTVEL